MSYAGSYAGIGSRQTPAEVLELMTYAGEKFARDGMLLRSGRARGADRAFEAGCDAAEGPKEIFRAEDALVQGKLDIGASELAKKYHPNWGACSWIAKQLHTRNVYIVLGMDLCSPVDEVICWTPNASGSGGTGQALRIAKAYEIPVIDLGDVDQLGDFMSRVNA